MWNWISVAVGAILAVAAAPGPPEDALKTFQATLRGIEAREAAWWKGLPDAEEKAHAEFHRPLRQQYAEKVHEPRPDFAPIRGLYGEALAFETERETAYRLLATSGHAKALSTLWKEVLAAFDLEARAERDNAPGELQRVLFLLRQGPSIRLHVLEFRRRALAQAIAVVPGATEFLGGPDAWKEARARDLAARSNSRRVFTVDALATLPDGAGRGRLVSLLMDEAPEVRIAALEGLGHGGDGPPFAAAPLLADPVPAVVFSVLEVLRANPPADPAWIEPLARTYIEGGGRRRADALRGLRSVTGRATTDDPAAWKAWLAETRSAREAGTFRRPETPADAESVTTPGPGDQARFWGIPVESDRVLLAADGWYTLVVPADHSFQAGRHVTDWITGQRGWRKERESVRDVIVRLLPPFLEGLPPGATFRILLLGSAKNMAGEVTWFDERGPLPPTPPNRRRAKAFLEDFHIGSSEFFQQGLQILLDTEEPDTAVFVTGGYLRTDRFLLPEALLAEFRRRNRFRRLRLHIVHVMDQGPESTRVLKEIAEAAGGTLVRALAPPPR